jgi:26S proteasome regulatory subunit N9
MAVDKPKAPKLDVDEYLTTALSATPAELHPFFESFRSLHSRKSVYQCDISRLELKGETGYGIS